MMTLYTWDGHTQLCQPLTEWLRSVANNWEWGWHINPCTLALHQHCNQHWIIWYLSKQRQMYAKYNLQHFWKVTTLDKSLPLATPEVNNNSHMIHLFLPIYPMHQDKGQPTLLPNWFPIMAACSTIFLGKVFMALTLTTTWYWYSQLIHFVQLQQHNQQQCQCGHAKHSCCAWTIYSNWELSKEKELFLVLATVSTPDDQKPLGFQPHYCFCYTISDNPPALTSYTQVLLQYTVTTKGWLQISTSSPMLPWFSQTKQSQIITMC